MEVTGYPPFVLYLILIIGLPLAHFRPYKGFLMAIFLITAADSSSFTYTKTEILGPFFNAYDACLIIAIISVTIYCLRAKRKLLFPNVIKYVFIVLTIGFAQSLFAIGNIDYHVLRAMRWAIALPAYFIIAATMVNDEKKAKSLLIVLFWGSVISAIEHIIYVKALTPDFLLYGNLGIIRSIAFRNPGLWILLSCLVWMPNIKSFKRPLMLGGLILFAISVLLNQTRSIWISSLIALPIVFLIFKQENIIKKAIITPIFITMLFVGITLGMHYTNPAIKTQNIIIERLMTFVDSDIRYRTTITRQLALSSATGRGRLDRFFGFGQWVLYFSDQKFSQGQTNEPTR
jgi:hypothetical protein